jgi:rhomboid protease GluP
MAGAALFQQNIAVFALVAIVVGLAGVKVIDLILSMKKGLAVVAGAFMLANPALVLLWHGSLAQALVLQCFGQGRGAITSAPAICNNIDSAIMVLPVAVLAFTALLYWPQFTRGLSDVGFVATGLRGERARRHRL